MSTIVEDDGEGFGLGEETEVKLCEARLGMTLENVLEQTIVHKVDSGGAASNAGVVAGVLVSGVGGESTEGLLHDDVIALLRKPQRPLVLRVRQVDEVRLDRRRKESRGALQQASVREDLTDAEMIVREAPVVALALNALRAAELVPAEIFATLHPEESPHFVAAQRVVDSTNPEERWDMDTKTLDVEDQIRRCELALAALDDALGADSDVGDACRRAVAEGVDHAAFAQAMCACIEYVPPPKKTSSSEEPPQPQQPKKTSSSAARMAVGPSAPARVDQDDDDLAELVTVCAADSVSSSTSDGDDGKQTVRDAACRWAAAAALVESDVSPLAARATRILARLAFAQLHQKENVRHQDDKKRRTTPQASTLPACLRLYRTSKSSSNASEPNGNNANANHRRVSGEAGRAAAIACCSVAPACAAALPRRLRPLIRHALTKIARESAHANARAAAARSLGAMGAVDPTPKEATWLVKLCDRLSRDALPCVRRGALDAALALAAAIPASLVVDERLDGSSSFSRSVEVHLLHCKLMPVATSLAEDSATEVRAAVARRAGALCDAFGEKRSAVVVDDARGLLEDAYPRVRCAAAKALPAVAAVAARFGDENAKNNSGDTCLSLLAPAASRLASDSNAEARAALAVSVGGFLAIACQEAHKTKPEAKTKREAGEAVVDAVFDRAVFPLALILINDEEPTVACAALDALASLADDDDSNFSNASGSSSIAATRRRYKQLSNYDGAPSWPVPIASSASMARTRRTSFTGRGTNDYSLVAGLAMLLADHHVSKLVLSLEDLATSRHWRVRARAATCVPALVPCCNAPNLAPRRKALARLCAQLCSDVVDEVRRSAARALCRAAVVDETVADKSFNGPSWLEDTSIPELERLSASTHHKDRKLAVIFARDLLSIAHSLDRSDLALDAVSRVALVLAADDQLLVRIGAAKLLAILPDRYLEDARDCALTLTSDADSDVAALASKSLAILASRHAAEVDKSHKNTDNAGDDSESVGTLEV